MTGSQRGVNAGALGRKPRKTRGGPNAVLPGVGASPALKDLPAAPVDTNEASPSDTSAVPVPDTTAPPPKAVESSHAQPEQATTDTPDLIPPVDQGAFAAHADDEAVADASVSVAAAEAPAPADGPHVATAPQEQGDDRRASTVAVGDAGTLPAPTPASGSSGSSSGSNVDIRKILASLSTETQPSGKPSEVAADEPVRGTVEHRQVNAVGQSGKEQQETLPAGQQDKSTAAVSVYILPEVLHSLREDREASRMLNSTIAFDAIDNAIKKGWMQWLVQRRHVVPRPKDSLFPDRSTTRRARSRRVREPKRRQWQAFLTQQEIDIIDDLAKTYNAESMSEIISVAVEAMFIPPSEDEQQRWRVQEAKARGIPDLDVLDQS